MGNPLFSGFLFLEYFHVVNFSQVSYADAGSKNKERYKGISRTAP